MQSYIAICTQEHRPLILWECSNVSIYGTLLCSTNALVYVVAASRQSGRDEPSLCPQSGPKQTESETPPIISWLSFAVKFTWGIWHGHAVYWSTGSFRKSEEVTFCLWHLSKPNWVEQLPVRSIGDPNGSAQFDTITCLSVGLRTHVWRTNLPWSHSSSRVTNLRFNYSLRQFDTCIQAF